MRGAPISTTSRSAAATRLRATASTTVCCVPPTRCSHPVGILRAVPWAAGRRVPPGRPAPDMQTRRIIDELRRGAAGTPQPTLESNSMIVLFAHVRTGRWASVMPAKLAETLGLTETIRAIPIVGPEAVHTIGLVVPAREPMTPLTAALVAEAQRLAPELDAGARGEAMADRPRAGSKHH